MPFRDALSSLRDIYEAIESIARFVEGMDFSAFQADEKTNAAVEPKLLVLSEAARRLGDDAERLCPGFSGKTFGASEIGCDINTTA